MFQLDSAIKGKTEQIENFSTCQICFEFYDYEKRHRSVLAECGHVLCLACATTIANTSKNCPTCRRPCAESAIIKIFEATWQNLRGVGYRVRQWFRKFPYPITRSPTHIHSLYKPVRNAQIKLTKLSRITWFLSFIGGWFGVIVRIVTKIKFVKVMSAH